MPANRRGCHTRQTGAGRAQPVGKRQHAPRRPQPQPEPAAGVLRAAGYLGFRQRRLRVVHVMSNALAIATVTATLRGVLKQALTGINVTGADVTSLRPDATALPNL